MSAESDRQNLIRKTADGLVFVSYNWAVRLKYLRFWAQNIVSYIQGDSLPQETLDTLTSIHRAWCYAAGIRAEQNRLILDTNLTVADASWPSQSDYAAVALPVFWTQGISPSAVNGLTAMVNGLIQTAMSNVADISATIATIQAELDSNEGLLAAIQAAQVQSASINDSGHLLITLANATVLDAGLVKGGQGDDGKGIASVSINGSNHLIIVFTDDSQTDAGAVNMGLATVATTGSYNDLSNKPSLSFDALGAAATAQSAAATDATTKANAAKTYADAGDATNAAAIAAETTARQSAITSEATTRASAVSSEASTRAAADTTNASAITSEASRATAAEGVNAAAISAETTARQSAITSEASSRNSGDSTNATAISAETTRATAAEATNATAITSEASTRAAADTTNANAITAETTARQSADTTLTTSVNAKAPSSRSIATTAPLAGGGDLSADRTLSITAATSSAAGSMSSTDKAKIDTLLAPTVQSLTPSANFTITPAAASIPTRTFTFVAPSTTSITATLGETGIAQGSELTITNTHASNSFFVTDTSGVSETSGNFTVGPSDSISFVYGPAAWYETSRSNN